ncbi:hypothetical protein MKW98_015133 [Papaver atlanticum]|uniref:Uncharacterized protein n=1 Tax=Papaver atlanticum TaxID=357466 RepID=A0AAD4S750_9MAGN|nr:hypothetical protein MKW98_015133 [Papaver atlanticum]
MIMVSTTADARKLDEKARREKMIECMDKDLKELNKGGDFGQTDEQLVAFQQIVNAEIAKHPLTTHTKEEVSKAFTEIKELVKIDPRLGDLPMEKVSKRIKDMALIALKCMKRLGN